MLSAFMLLLYPRLQNETGFVSANQKLTLHSDGDSHHDAFVTYDSRSTLFFYVRPDSLQDRGKPSYRPEPTRSIFLWLTTIDAQRGEASRGQKLPYMLISSACYTRPTHCVEQLSSIPALLLSQIVLSRNLQGPLLFLPRSLKSIRERSAGLQSLCAPGF